MSTSFEEQLSPVEREFVKDLDSAVKIQAFLDTIPYSPDEINRSPLEVLRDRRAHCLDGALFAAAMLRRLGHKPVIIDLLPIPGTDDDHVLAIFKQNGGYGALAKSNYSGLRFREAVYRNVRELVMSYFEVYFNLYGQKTLLACTRPYDLTTMNRYNWATTASGADAVEKLLKRLHPYPLITPEMAASLSPVDQRSFDAGRLGSDPDGIYQPHT